MRIRRERLLAGALMGALAAAAVACGSTGGGRSGDGGAGGGSGGTGGGSGGTGGAVCTNGDPCTSSCAGTVCGLARLGTRDCPCTGGVYVCDACGFNIGPGAPVVIQPPATPLPTCAADVGDGIRCPSVGDRCSCTPGMSTGCLAGVSSTAAHACVCWLRDDAGALVWDCDRQPW
jgi:hypothetical protein